MQINVGCMTASTHPYLQSSLKIYWSKQNLGWCKGLWVPTVFPEEQHSICITHPIEVFSSSTPAGVILPLVLTLESYYITWFFPFNLLQTKGVLMAPTSPLRQHFADYKIASQPFPGIIQILTMHPQHSTWNTNLPSES